MNRARQVLLDKVVLGGVLLFVLIVIGFKSVANSESLERFVERRVTASTGRMAQIGDLHFRIGRCLHMTARDVKIGNPAWAKSAQLIDAQRLSGCAAWLPLLAGRLDLQEVTIDHTRLGLEREGDRVTWKLDEKGDEGKSRVNARHVSIVDSRVYFRDRDENTELDINLSGGYGQGDEVRAQAKGRFRDAQLQLDVKTLALMPSAESPTPVSATGQLGHTKAAAEGHFKEIGFEGMDVQLKLEGDDLSEINRLGINLPATPPYKLHGRLKFANNTWEFAAFEGRIGDSDVNGDLAFTKREPRPFLRADISSRLLDFDDLGPLVGAPPKTRAGETASPQQKAQAQQVSSSDRVLPTKPLGIEKWPRMDADVKFRADRVLRPKAIPMNGLSTHLTIENTTMRLQPLDFEIAGGHIKADITIDGKEAPPRAVASFDIDNLQLTELFPKLGQQRAAAGALFGKANFDARGNSIAGFAGTANGEITLMVNGGHISALLLELMGLDAGEAVAIVVSRGDKPVTLRCAIADFDLNSGQATPRLAVVDTVDTVFFVDGKVDLGEELLDLKLTPQPKDQSMPVVRTPLLVSGTFNDPNVHPEAAPLALRGGAAVALGLINPLLALIPLIETGPGKDSDCAAFAALAQAEGVKTPLANEP